MNSLLYDTAFSWIPRGAQVLDLGCGDGGFLERLEKDSDIRGEGVERDPECVMRCVERGIHVHDGDLLDGLDQHADQSFDFILLLGTFQELLAPKDVLAESFRVGRQVILGHLNFAYYKYRFQLSWGGRTPRTDEQALPWHDSPNIQLFSVEDFIRFCNHQKIRRVRSAFFHRHGRVRFWPNLLAKDALWLLEPPV